MLGRTFDFVCAPAECALERISLALSNPEKDRVIPIGHSQGHLDQAPSPRAGAGHQGSVYTLEKAGRFLNSQYIPEIEARQTYLWAVSIA
jgi:hypothetical protein